MGILAVRGLTKSYGRRPPALRDVTLDVGPGVTGLLGPNGAGKSTLIQCVLGLLRGWSGQAEVLGLDARRSRWAIRRRVGLMPETDAYLPHMTGIRAVRYLGQLTGMPHREALRRAHEVLFHVGLGEAVYRDVQEYSTGMRQRFKLAQALVHDPEILFLDEPTSGLDPAGRDDLLALILDLARHHGKHVLLSSHILPEVQKIADAVVVLDKGRCRGSVRLEDLRTGTGAYDVEVEGDPEAFRAALEGRGMAVERRAEDGAADGPPSPAGRTLFTVRPAAGASAGTILTAARPSGARVRRLAPQGETLEDAFLRLVADGEEA